jgi:hypothetical protein
VTCHSTGYSGNLEEFLKILIDDGTKIASILSQEGLIAVGKRLCILQLLNEPSLSTPPSINI